MSTDYANWTTDQLKQEIEKEKNDRKNLNPNFMDHATRIMQISHKIGKYESELNRRPEYLEMLRKEADRKKDMKQWTVTELQNEIEKLSHQPYSVYEKYDEELTGRPMSSWTDAELRRELTTRNNSRDYENAEYLQGILNKRNQVKGGRKKKLTKKGKKKRTSRSSRRR
jgi:hypothetical protein